MYFTLVNLIQALHFKDFFKKQYFRSDGNHCSIRLPHIHYRKFGDSGILQKCDYQCCHPHEQL